MFASLSLHLALHLVPYLDPTDMACARGVCKDWYRVFSSNALARVALRMHFPLCHEVRSPSQPLDYSMFNRISRRHAALKSGVPRLELRARITASCRDTYIWTFAENLLVLQTSQHPRAVLTLIFLDVRTKPKRVIGGKLVLDASGITVKRVKVCRNILVVERISERMGNPARVCSVDCFRVSLSPGDSEVVATKVSSFDTFRPDYTSFSGRPTSDHSGKYYAAYSGAANPSVGALQIWDIEAGKMVRRIPAQQFPNVLNVAAVLVIARKGPNGPQQVVVFGSNRGNWAQLTNCHPCQSQVTLDWDYMANFKVFAIEPGSLEWGGCVRHKEGQGRSRPLTLEEPLATSFKVPRCPAGITSLDAPGASDDPGYLAEEIGFTLWHWNPDAGDVYSSYHSVVPDRPPANATGVPLAIEREFRIAPEEDPCCSPFSVGFRSGVSLTLEADFEDGTNPGIRLIPYQLSIRGFYPSATPGVMELDWETPLKSSEDRRKRRVIVSLSREVNSLPLMMAIDGSELATAFLDFSSERGTEVVVLLWD